MRECNHTMAKHPVCNSLYNLKTKKLMLLLLRLFSFNLSSYLLPCCLEGSMTFLLDVLEELVLGGENVATHCAPHFLQTMMLL